MEGLSGTNTNSFGFKDDKILKEFLPHPQIFSKVEIIKQGFEQELVKLEEFSQKTAQNCEEILSERKKIHPVCSEISELKLSIEGFFCELTGKNNSLIHLKRVFKASEEGFSKKLLAKLTEGKKEIIIVVKDEKNEREIGVYFEDGLDCKMDTNYAIFSVKDKKMLKKGRNWGSCCCKNKEKMLFTSSNIHEIVVFENCCEGVLLRDATFDINGVKEPFKVMDIVIYEILE